MPTLEKNNNRPFGQRAYNPDLLRPTFSDYHYKFILIIPISESVIGRIESKPVFKEEDLRDLEKLFRSDFGGYSIPKQIDGQWDNPNKEIVSNEHVRYDVYSQRNKLAIDYFTELQQRLHIRAVERDAKQDIIVVEQIEITFINKPSFDMEFLKILMRDHMKYE